MGKAKNEINELQFHKIKGNGNQEKKTNGEVRYIMADKI